MRAARPTLTADQIAQVMRLSANDIAPPGWDPSAGFGMLNIDKALAQQPPPPDPLEPNDEIVWIDGRAFGKKDPAVFGGRRTVRFVALLDALEDPEDVYRIVLPGRRKVLVSVKPAFGDTDVAVYDKRATSSTSARASCAGPPRGSKTDAVTVRNRGRGSRSAYVRVFIHPRAKTLNAAYITIRRAARPLLARARAEAARSAARAPTAPRPGRRSRRAPPASAPGGCRAGTTRRRARP